VHVESSYNRYLASEIRGTVSTSWIGCVKVGSLEMEERFRANIAHTRQSRPDSGLGFQVKFFEMFQGVSSSLGSGARYQSSLGTRASGTRGADECRTHTTRLRPRSRFRV
jgi:hypothetical protein